MRISPSLIAGSTRLENVLPGGHHFIGFHETYYVSVRRCPALWAVTKDEYQKYLSADCDYPGAAARFSKPSSWEARVHILSAIKKNLHH